MQNTLLQWQYLAVCQVTVLLEYIKQPKLLLIVMDLRNYLESMHVYQLTQIAN